MLHSYKFSKKILRFAQDDSKQTKDDNKQTKDDNKERMENLFQNHHIDFNLIVVED